MRANKSSLFFASALVVVAAFTTTACSVTTSGDEPRADGDEAETAETTATTSSALNNSGHGGGLGLYSCSGLMCTCTGDVDCNDMFTNAGCGDVSKCDDSGPEPVCWCLKGLRHTTPKGDAGVVKAPRVGAKLSP